MTLATLIRQWSMNWMQADQLATVELEERQALARDLGLTDGILAHLATLGPEAGRDLPVLVEAIFARLA